MERGKERERRAHNNKWQNKTTIAAEGIGWPANDCSAVEKHDRMIRGNIKAITFTEISLKYKQREGNRRSLALDRGSEGRCYEGGILA